MRRFRFHGGIVVRCCSIYIILPFSGTFFSYCTRLLRCSGRCTRCHTRRNCRFSRLHTLRDIFFHIGCIFDVRQVIFLQKLQFYKTVLYFQSKLSQSSYIFKGKFLSTYVRRGRNTMSSMRIARLLKLLPRISLQHLEEQRTQSSRATVDPFGSVISVEVHLH